MFYYLHELEHILSPLRVFRYITVRAVAGGGTAFLLTIFLGPLVIGLLRRFNIGQYVRNDEEAPGLYVLHAQKAGTPTMGGLLIIISILVSTLLWSVPGNSLVLMVLASMCLMGALGFWDDYKKISGKHSKGVSSLTKIILQISWGLVAAGLLFYLPETRSRLFELMVPFFKDPVVQNMGVICAFLFVVLIIVGVSNAVNLTDGLDGLAIGCSSSVALSYMIFAYFAGHMAFADYLNVPYIKGAGEVAVFCGCLMGACLGFLWYNCHPASIFMGDTGSLALGGAIAMVAIVIKHELVLIIVGGVFVMEAASVILQVASFKMRGKRIFAMAPLHHHFEVKKKSWSETQVVIRFWILSIIFALLGMLTLKVR